MIELLEPRRLLAAGASLSHGVLRVTGTYKDDLIRIVQKNDKLVVTINGEVSKFTQSKVRKTIVSGNRGDDRILLSVGVVTYLGGAAPGGGTAASVPINTTKILAVYGGGGSDTIDSAGGSQDFLFGEDGDDYLRSVTHAGGNHLNGGGGNDTLMGGVDGDDFVGGDGDDTVDYSDHGFNNFISLDDVANDGYRGVVFDVPFNYGTNDVIYTGSSEGDNCHSDIETVIGGDGNDSIAGSASNNLLIGSKGNDTLDGGSGNDSLDGGAGADHLIGGPGNDTAVMPDGTDTVGGDIETQLLA